MNKVLPFLFFLFVFSKGYSQVIEKKAELFLSADSSFNIRMDGNLDGQNTFTWKDFEGSRYSIGFQPMKSVTISNIGNTFLKNPRIIINERGNWYNLSELNQEIFGGTTAFKEKFLRLWDFTLQNSIHRYYPEFGYSIGPPVKLFGSYGYGQCFNLASMITMLPSNSVDIRYDLFYTLHSISEFGDGENKAVFDGDIRTFYLNYDNNTLASLEDVGLDRYLVKRTHHYGKQFKFDYGVNNYISQVYGLNGIYSGKVEKIDYNIEYMLRPGESLTYSWDTAKYQFSNWSQDAEPSEVANCSFLLNVDSANFSSLDSIFYFAENVEVNNDTTEKYFSLNSDSSEFGIELNYSFPILNFEADLNLFSDKETTLLLYFSCDSITWKEEQILLDSGNSCINYTLGDKMKEVLPCGPIEKIFVRIKNGSNSPLLKFYSVNINSTCQVNRFFLPSLQLGNNKVQYFQDNKNKSNVILSIEWVENYENAPPTKVIIPIYPNDQAEVNQLKFTFTWENATDTDGDQIINYEFQLSDRQDMKYPLSPTFNVYTYANPAFQFTGEIKSTLNARNNTGNILLGDVSALKKLYPLKHHQNSRVLSEDINQFQVPLDGLLNSGQKYYWRVRAQDDKGNWGDWSQTWSFTPIGIMPPKNFRIKESFDSLNNIKDITLFWNPNSSKIKPHHYEIHGSNEWLGFSPGNSTLISTTSDTIFDILNSDSVYFCYRVIAVDSVGNKSGPSPYVTLEAPYALNRPDTIYLNQPYRFELNLPKIWYPNLNISDNQSMAINEEYTFEVNSPSWLAFDPDTQIFSGIPDSSIFSDTSSSNAALVEITIHANLIRKSFNQFLLMPFETIDDYVNDSLEIVNGSLNEIQTQAFYTFPNPVSNELVIAFNSADFKKEEIVIEVLDLFGRNMLKKIITKSQSNAPHFSYKVRLHRLKTGVYILKVLADKKHYYKKIEVMTTSAQ